MATKEIGEQHSRLLRALYELSRNATLGSVYVHRLGQEMGMNTVGFGRDRDELAKLARELEEAGYIQRRGGRYTFHPEREERKQTESREEGYGYLSLTDEGRRKVEEELL